MLTLHHFVHPIWFEKQGGFSESRNIPDFVNFATFAFRWDEVAGSMLFCVLLC